MNLLSVTEENIDREHICCAITEKKGEQCVSSKKKWMREGFKNGLVFTKLDVRGKVFIEYIPGEEAFAPIHAPGYMYINCFWVSGKYKGQGFANALLDSCIRDAKEKGKKGLVILTSSKKKPFLSDPKYLLYKGFQVCDEAPPYYRLMYLPFKSGITAPKFTSLAKTGEVAEKGVVLYYTHQCPHTVKYVALVETLAKELNIPMNTVILDHKKKAQEAPCPFTTYTLYVNGKFETNEILTEKKFIAIMKREKFID